MAVVMDAYGKSTATPTVAKPAATAKPKGDAATMELQRKLNALGANLVVDGIRGPKTEAAYQQFMVAPAPNVAKPTTPAQPISPVAPAQQPTVNPAGSGSLFEAMGYKPTQYTSEYDALIKSNLDKLLNAKPFDPTSYDVEKDPAFIQYRDNALKAGEKAYSAGLASRNVNGLAESSVATQIAQGAKDGFVGSIKNKIMDFMNAAEDRYTQDINRTYNNLNTLRGIDNTQYDRTMDLESRNINAKNDYQNDTGYLAVDTSSIPKDSWLRSYSDNYKAEMDRRSAINPNDPIIQMLAALRNEKIAASPELTKQYGSTVSPVAGIKSADTLATEAKAAEKTSKSAKVSGVNSKVAETLGTTDQISAYYNYITSYTTGDYAGNPVAAYTDILRNKGAIETKLGTKLYDQLISDFKDLDTVTGTVPKDVPMAIVEDPYYKEASSRMESMRSATTGNGDKKVPTYTAQQINDDMVNWLKAQPLDPQVKANIAIALGLGEVTPEKEPGSKPGWLDSIINMFK